MTTKNTKRIRVQEVAKILNKAGLKKATTKRENFKTIHVGHYEAKQFNSNGISCFIAPKNGTKVECIINILVAAGIGNVSEKRGYAIITY